MKTRFVVLMGAVVLLGSMPLAAQTLTLADFEGKLDAGWEKNGAQSAIAFPTEHVTSGTQSLKLTVVGQYAGVLCTRPPADWRGYDLLAMDVFSDAKTVLRLNVSLRDATSGDSYMNRTSLELAVRPGQTRLEVPISGIKANNGRLLDLGQMAQLLIMFDGQTAAETVYLDNIRLEKKKVTAVEGLRAFDFGTAVSPLYAGFTRVTEKTAYDAAQGFGWTDTAELTSADHVTVDDLVRDWVRGPGTFRIDVPNGTYHVWMLMEDSGDWWFRRYYERLTVKAEGKTVIDERQTRAEWLKNVFFANADVEDLPGQDVFNVYVMSRWFPKTFAAEVTDGRLEIELGGDQWAPLVNAMVVYPERSAAAGAQWLKDLTQERAKLFHNTYVEVPPPVEEVAVRPTDDEKRAGYVLFRRPWQDTVWSTSKPYVDDRFQTLKVSCARGEYEPITFSVFPLQDLGQVTVSVDALVGPNGAARAGTGIEPGYVQYHLKRTEGKSTTYRMMPWLLRKGDTARADVGLTRRFWLTLTVSADEPGGTYATTIHVRPERGEARDIRLEVEVRPFALMRPTDRYFAMNGTRPQEFYTFMGGTEDSMWQAFEQAWVNQRRHGFNTIITGSELATLTRIMDICTRQGTAQVMKCWLSHEARFRPGIEEGAWRQMQPVLERAKERHWPTPVFTFLDEPSNGGEPTRSEALKVTQALAKLRAQPGVKLSGDLNNSADTVFFPYLDYSGINEGVRINPATLRKIRDDKSVPWLVNAGKDRFRWGLWFYKLSSAYDVEFKEDYAYQTWHGDPYFDLDAWNSDYCAAYPGPDGDVNTLWFEECREGIDDFCYLYILEKLIEANEADRSWTCAMHPQVRQDKPGRCPICGMDLVAVRTDPVRRRAAAEARKWLDELMGRVDADYAAQKSWRYPEIEPARDQASAFIVRLSP